MTQLKFVLLTLVAILSVQLSQQQAQAAPIDAIKYMPVQDGGRVKPYDTFAREALQLITGAQTWEGRPADAIIVTWMLVPEQWNSKKVIQVSHRGLKEALKVDLDQKMFSPDELVQNARVGLVFQELAAKREAKEKLDPFYQAAARLQNQLGTFMSIRSGEALRVVPPSQGALDASKATPMGMPRPSTAWTSVAELKDRPRDTFVLMTKAFIERLAADEDTADGKTKFEQAVQDFVDSARAVNPAAYASDARIKVEVLYNSLHPFKWAWIFYLFSALCLAFALQSGRLNWYRAGWTLTGIAFALHTFGFVLRCYLAGRPPVSNMYESIVWVSWGAMFFTGIFEIKNHKRFILLAGNLVAVVALIMADIAPAIIDSSIQPLEPVLRSNLWLSIHVLTITLSYSAFFLAFGLGDIGLLYILKGDSENSERVRSVTLSIYRAIQVGVVLLAAGTILGGVWADYSWGRFWGWDPKETWAFIVLLGYLAVLHARLVGWLRNYGLIATSVVAFSLVIMAWYGVNYVLGAGLHSYGFGAGGVQYVAAFVIAHLIYVGYVTYIMRARHSTVRGDA